MVTRQDSKFTWNIHWNDEIHQSIWNDSGQSDVFNPKTMQIIKRDSEKNEDKLLAVECWSIWWNEGNWGPLYEGNEEMKGMSSIIWYLFFYDWECYKIRFFLYLGKIIIGSIGIVKNKNRCFIYSILSLMKWSLIL